MAKRLIADTMNRGGVEFDTGGLRGDAARLTDELCYAYAAAFAASVANDCSRIVVGYDRRPSSPRIAAACAAAFLDTGREIVHAGPVPASLVALAARRRGTCAVMVTGGAGDDARNGLRFFGPDGELGLQQARWIGATEVDVPAGVVGAELGPVDATVARDGAQRLVGWLGHQALAGMTVGVAGDGGPLSQALAALGARVVALEDPLRVAPVFARDVEETFAQLAADACARRPLDAVVALGADGCRPLLADARGAVQDGTAIAAIAAALLGATTVVAPAGAGGALEGCGAFRRVVRAGPALRRVLDALRREAGDGVALGCDADGALLVAHDLVRADRRLDALPVRDGTLPLATVLAAARDARGGVAQVMAPAPRRHVAHNALPGVGAARVEALLALLAADADRAAGTLAPDAGAVVSIDRVDGLRVRFANGDVMHLRGLAPAGRLACSAEADTRERAERLCGEGLARVAGWGEAGAVAAPSRTAAAQA